MQENTTTYQTPVVFVHQQKYGKKQKQQRYFGKM